MSKGPRASDSEGPDYRLELHQKTDVGPDYHDGTRPPLRDMVDPTALNWLRRESTHNR